MMSCGSHDPATLEVNGEPRKVHNCPEAAITASASATARNQVLAGTQKNFWDVEQC